MRITRTLEILVFCCWIISCPTLTAQFDDWKYEVILSAEEDIKIHASTVDAQGMLWLGTRFGITTFDGNKYLLHPIFQQAHLQSKTLNCRYLKFDPQGRLWIMTDDRGVLIYDFKSGQYWTISSDSDADIHISNPRSGGVLFDNDVAWMTTNDHKLHRISLSQLSIQSHDAWPVIKEHYPEGNLGTVGSIIKTKGILWIGTKKGIVKFNLGTKEFGLILYRFESSVERVQRYSFPMFLNGEDILIGAPIDKNTGFCILSTKTEKWKGCSDFDLVEPHFLNLSLRSFTRWSDSLIIAGSQRFALHAINPFTYETKTVFEQDVDLDYRAFQELGTIHKVNDELAYIVSYDHIVRMRKFKSPFTYLPINPSGKRKSNWQRDFVKTESGGYIGTFFGDGLIHLDWEKKSLEHFPYQADLRTRTSHFDVESIVRRPDDKLWLATSEGVLIFDPKSKAFEIDTVVGLYPPHSPIADIRELFLFDQYLFIKSRSQGLLLYNVKTQFLTKIETSEDESLPSPLAVSDMISITPSTFYLTTSNGLRELIVKGDKDFKLEIPQEILDHQLGKIDLSYFIKTDNAIFIGANGNGLFELNLEDDRIGNIINHINPENIRYNIIGKMALSSDSNSLWFGSGDGITKFNRETKLFSNYSVKEGIGFRGRSGKFFHYLNDSIILCGAHLGLHHFNPRETETKLVPIKPYFQSVKVNQKLIPTSFYDSNDISLPKSTGNLTIEMGAINYNPHPNTYYSYRLSGYDEYWSQPSRNNAAYYTKLPGGEYTFEFRVANNNFKWENGQQLKISKTHRVTEHYLFLPTLAFILVGLLYLLYRYRLQVNKKSNEQQQRLLSLQKEKIESELRALRAQMNPHFLFNTLNSINWYIIKNKTNEASRYLTKFSKLMRLILENSKVDLIALSTELQTLELYLELESLRFEGQFDYKISIADTINLTTTLVPPLIVQPFVENAIWHGLLHKSTKGTIDLEISTEDNLLKIIVADDGVGRAAAQKMKQKTSHKKVSNGIRITTKRLSVLANKDQQQIIFTDLKDQDDKPIGTKVELFIPLNLHF